MAKPGELALGVMAGILFGFRGGLGKPDVAGKMADQPRHAMSFHRRQQRVETTGRKRRDFLKCARCQHGVEPCIDMLVKHGAVGREKDRDGARRIERRRHAFAMPIGNRAAGRLQHFERAGDAWPVGWLQAARRYGIAPRKLGVQRRRT